jgi:hypothetical protein
LSRDGLKAIAFSQKKRFTAKLTIKVSRSPPFTAVERLTA